MRMSTERRRYRASRWVLVTALSALAPAAAAEVPRFDHRIEAHAGRSCTDCHRLAATDWRRASPAPGGGHAPCIDCHADAWRASSTWVPLCVTCHRLDGRGRPRSARFWAPRQRGPSDFWLAAFDHGAHRARAAAGEADAGCRACHAGPDRADGFARPGHGACASCHGQPDGPAPTMARCTDCHRPRGDALIPPAASGVEHAYRMTAGFDHRRHAPHGARCADCHAVDPPAGAVVPLPHKPACSGCHDGSTAFAVTGTRCRSCHVVSER